jgi:hypothetical protein
MSSYIKLIRAFASLLPGIYGSMLLNGHLGVSILPSLSAGLVIALIVFWFLGYTNNKTGNNIFDKRLILLSLGIAGILIITDPGHLNPVIKPQKIARIIVTASGEKNDSAKQNEVRITNIYNGSQELKLQNIPLTGGWRKKDNTLVSSSGQPNIIELAIDDPDSLKLAFSRNPMAGKVKIEEDTITTVEDLYSNTKGTYLYTSHSNITSTQNIYEKTALTAVSFLALGIFWYISLLWVRLKNSYHLLAIPLSLLLFYVSDYFEGSFLKRLILCALSVCSFYLLNGQKARAFISNYTRKDKVIILLIITYATFAFIGYRLFLAEFPINDALSKLVHFILFGGWLTSILLAFLYLTELCKRAVIKRSTDNTAHHHSQVKLYFTFAGIILLCWLVYLTGFFPAIMSADSLVQWEQITGLSKIDNWHPVIHTMFNKFFLSIYNSPVSVALAQMFLMAGIAANFFLFLYKKGIPAKWLMWFALGFALIPANGVYSVTIWKDIPFTFSLLWLTLVLAKIVIDDTYIKKFPSYIEIILALVCAALFRHNGLPVFMLAVAGLLIYFFKTKKIGLVISVAISVGLVALYNFYISDPSRVIPNPPSVKLVAPVHGMAAVRYYGGHLSADATQEMEKVLPDSIWVNFYNPFSADEYIYFCKRPFIENLANLPTGKAVSLYANAFAQNPYLVIRDRLCGAELLWNVYDAPGAYNYKYHTQIDENKLGLTMSDNFVKKILAWYLEQSERLGDPIFWRAGIYNILILLLLFAFLKQRKSYLLIFIPIIGSILALLLSMTIQNYRYVYFAPLIFGFIWLLYISNFKSVTNFNKSIKAK